MVTQTDIITVMQNTEVSNALTIGLILGILTIICLIGIFTMLILLNKNLKK